MEKVLLKEIGELRYREAWELQESLFSEVVAKKLERRENNAVHENGLHYLLLCTHPHVYTLGRNGKEQHLLLKEEALVKAGIDYFHINRGGDITYHGPGQLVGYPILDLDCIFTDIGKYLRTLEEVIICTLEDFGLKGERLPGATGVWLEAENPFRARKVCAMGIRASRWVTMHGFALNINTDLSYFEKIIPCGISDKSVSSMAKELGRDLDVAAVSTSLKSHFENCFQVKLESSTRIASPQHRLSDKS